MARFQLHTSVTTTLKFFFAALLLSLLALTAMYYLNERFALLHISSQGTVTSPSSPLPKEVHAALTGPCTYLSQGSQMYVFETQDQKYVIKFFKHQRYRIPSFLRSASLPTFQKKIYEQKLWEKEQKLCRLYKSLQIATNDLNEMCAVIYTHLERSNDLHIETDLVDKLKRNYHVSLDDYEFVVQKKATLLLPLLTKLIESNEIDEAKRRLDQLVTLLNSRFQKGVIDNDCALTKNVGFLDDSAIFIDLGQFYKTKEILSFQEAEDPGTFFELQTWLARKSPPLADYLSEIIKRRLHFF